MSAEPMAGTDAHTGRDVARAMSASTSRASAPGNSAAITAGVATTPSMSDDAAAQRISSTEVVARKMRMTG